MDERFTRLYLEEADKLKVKPAVRDLLFRSGACKVTTSVDLPNKILLSRLTAKKEVIYQRVLLGLPATMMTDFLWLE